MYCSVCRENKKEGIKFLNAHICKDCLNAITKTRVEDAEYEYYMYTIKNILKECQTNY
ncbi:sigma factor G inhibitor Gin [Sporanaerobacter acetigenes]|uniref:sigma factor G inhibitor Gin n=1 Tax=Sporanaerobacter acetigenes TaxID=165813 RepID=UPI000A03142A|nr:sigma factor G inhibitor Gin [Sporanaerobacter acetigenes]